MISHYCLCILPALAFATFDPSFYDVYGGDHYLVDVPQRSEDIEDLPSPNLWGAKFISGGTGRLLNYPEFPEQEVKTDKVLPAYCEPPNPCPPGFSESDGCITKFRNTADFSRNYQAAQDCMCDKEHMKSCDNADMINARMMQEALDPEQHHMSVVAKKMSIK